MTSHQSEQLGIVDRYFAAARIAHEHAFDLYGELVALDATDDHVRQLLHESAEIVLKRMPALRARQSQILAELTERVRRARHSPAGPGA